jgi:hypothetical protein
MGGYMAYRGGYPKPQVKRVSTVFAGHTPCSVNMQVRAINTANHPPNFFPDHAEWFAIREDCARRAKLD